jgi:ADP-heptose:LPS heptosyltransferase
MKLPEKGRFLVIRLGSVGDVVRTLPAVSALRLCYPEATIDWVVQELSAEVVRSFQDVDDVLVLPRKRWVRMIKKPKYFLRMFREIMGWIRALRRRKYDVILDFHGILKSGIIGALSGAKQRIGFKKGYCREFNYLFNRLHVDPGDTRLSRVYKNLEMVHAVGCDRPLPKVWLTPSAKDFERIESFLEGIQPVKSPIIAIQPSSSRNTDFKRWFPERYARLCDALVERLNATIILTWGPGGRKAVEEIQGLMIQRSYIACSTSLMELSALFQKCDIYIGGDTGPMHLACFSGLPAVVIYGPTDPLVNAPYPHSHHRIVRVDLPCSPCRDKTCERLDCMKQVTSEMVFKEAVALWEEVHENSATRKEAVVHL